MAHGCLHAPYCQVRCEKELADFICFLRPVLEYAHFHGADENAPVRQPVVSRVQVSPERLMGIQLSSKLGAPL